MSLRAAVKLWLEPVMHRVEAGSGRTTSTEKTTFTQVAFLVPFFNIHVTAHLLPPTHIHLCLLGLYIHREQGRSCSTSEATTRLLLGKSGRSSTSYIYTSLPRRQARKSHRPFNLGINDQHQHTASKTRVYELMRVYTHTETGRGGAKSAEGEMPRRREMRCGKAR